MMMQSTIDNITLKQPMIEPFNNIYYDEDEEEDTTSEDSEMFCEILNDFNNKISVDKTLEFSDQLLDELNESLIDNSPITMLPNFNIRPTGKEAGKFLIIDLGGSTLRIAIIEIQPDSSSLDANNSSESLEIKTRSERIHIVTEQKWIISNNEKTIDSNFFKFIGTKIVDTIKLQDKISMDEVINVGITWSFPLNQTSHNSGTINNVGKGWIIANDIYDKDLKIILEQSLKSNFNITIDVKVVINDSLAVYAAGSFLSSNLKLAMVLGTGYNICCSLETDKLHADKTLQQEAILVNSETSLFGAMLQPLSNEFDGLIDDRFLNPQLFKSYMQLDNMNNTIFQPFEIMTSGRYLPELTRLSIMKLFHNNEIFCNLNVSPSNKIFLKYDGFSNEILCLLSENIESMEFIKQEFIKEFGQEFIDVNILDLYKIQSIINSIIKRASYIISISIISFIKLLVFHNNESFPHNKLIIGYVGSILMYFNNYRNLILDLINNNKFIKDLGITVDLMSIDDSSIVGAAIGAAYYT